LLPIAEVGNAGAVDGAVDFMLEEVGDEELLLVLELPQDLCVG
jgi:hypothetical protein